MGDSVEIRHTIFAKWHKYEHLNANYFIIERNIAKKVTIQKELVRRIVAYEICVYLLGVNQMKLNSLCFYPKSSALYPQAALAYLPC